MNLSTLTLALASFASPDLSSVTASPVHALFPPTTDFLRVDVLADGTYTLGLLEGGARPPAPGGSQPTPKSGLFVPFDTFHLPADGLVDRLDLDSYVQAGQPLIDTEILAHSGLFIGDDGRESLVALSEHRLVTETAELATLTLLGEFVDPLQADAEAREFVRGLDRLSHATSEDGTSLPGCESCEVFVLRCILKVVNEFLERVEACAQLFRQTSQGCIPDGSPCLEAAMVAEVRCRQDAFKRARQEALGCILVACDCFLRCGGAKTPAPCLP